MECSFCPTEKVNDYFVNDFFKYQEELKYLFEVNEKKQKSAAENAIEN